MMVMIAVPVPSECLSRPRAVTGPEVPRDWFYDSQTPLTRLRVGMVLPNLSFPTRSWADLHHACNFSRWNASLPRIQYRNYFFSATGLIHLLPNISPRTRDVHSLLSEWSLMSALRDPLPKFSTLTAARTSSL
jgi:hypothetical protein